MNVNLKSKIIQAIKNFDINKLETLLDDERSYMDVSKSLFLITLEKKFKSAQKNGCNSFDDVFFGICGSCNKGCEGVTFFSNTGYYLDLFFEGDNESVTDIYVCNKLTNFTDLEKVIDLGFYFSDDEKVNFKPDERYMFIDQQYNSIMKDISIIKPNIKLDELVDWYNHYSKLRTTIKSISLYRTMRYNLYNKVFDLTREIDWIVKLKEREFYAIDALIDFKNAKTERDMLIWFFENREDQYCVIFYMLDKRKDYKNILNFKSTRFEFTVDISGYEYVLDYFRKIDVLYEQLMERYSPLQEHYDRSPTGSIEATLERLLELHNVHLDLVEKYGRTFY